MLLSIQPSNHLLNERNKWGSWRSQQSVWWISLRSTIREKKTFPQSFTRTAAPSASAQVLSPFQLREAETEKQRL